MHRRQRPRLTGCSSSWRHSSKRQSAGMGSCSSGSWLPPKTLKTQRLHELLMPSRSACWARGDGFSWQVLEHWHQMSESAGMVPCTAKDPWTAAVRSTCPVSRLCCDVSVCPR